MVPILPYKTGFDELKVLAIPGCLFFILHIKNCGYHKASVYIDCYFSYIYYAIAFSNSTTLLEYLTECFIDYIIPI